MESVGTIYAFIIIIGIALVFDFLNGFHDAANSIATIVATKVLTPLRAVVWAAFFNFVAAFGFGLHVARTMGKGVVRIPADNAYVYVILAGLVGAIVWDIVTWYAGLPTSSSHALIGGLAGASVTKAHGFQPLIASGLYKIAAFIALSPLIGMLLGFTIMTVVTWICRYTSPGRVDKWFRRLQLLSAASYSLGHGLNEVIDFINATCVRLDLYGVEAPTGDALRLANLIVLASEETLYLVREMKNRRQRGKMKRRWIEIHRLENEGDAISRAAIAKLFHERVDPVELIKWKEIYEHLETAIDKCEDAANIVEQVELKNA